MHAGVVQLYDMIKLDLAGLTLLSSDLAASSRRPCSSSPGFDRALFYRSDSIRTAMSPSPVEDYTLHNVTADVTALADRAGTPTSCCVPDAGCGPLLQFSAACSRSRAA